MPCFKASDSKTLPEVAVVVARLQMQKASRPRTIKTLSSTISALFQKQLAEDELAALVAELLRRGLVIQHADRVSYALPEAAG